MERAGDFLGRVVRHLESPEAALAWLASAWPAIVGKSLAAHTRPMHCHAGSLEIAADSKAWRAELEPMAREFCARINQAWGRTLVREVKFLTAKRAFLAPQASAPSPSSGSRRAPSGPGPERVPRELDNEHIPFIRRRKS